MISDDKDNFEKALSLSDAFSKAQKLDLISGNNLKKKDIEDIQNQIAELEKENEEFAENSETEQLANLDKEQAVKAANIQGQLKPLRANRTRILNKIESTQKTLDGLLAPTKEELQVLQSFFPDTNMKKLYAVEQFHNSMSIILKEELEQNLVQYKIDLQNIDSKISILEHSLQTFAPGKTLSKAAYTEYAARFNKIQKLQEKLDNFQKSGKLKVDTETARTTFFAKEIDVLNDIASSINAKMAEFNAKIQNGKWTNPVLSFEEPKTATAKGISNYALTSKSDHGDGTQGAELLLFDFSVLQMTKLPVLIHDGFVRKELDSDREQDFIKLFASEGKKQIFTEFNDIGHYSEEIQNLINNDLKVLGIGSGENGLYGRSFATKKN